MSTNKTSNYSLNQWVKSDQVRMEDFNDDNAKIDAALKAHDTALASKASAAALSSLQSVVNSMASASALAELQSTVDGLKTGKADKSALNTLSATVAQHTASLAKKGNCVLYTTTYSGSGDYENFKTLTFSSQPLLVVISGGKGLMVMVQGVSNAPSIERIYLYMNDVTWSGNSVSWRHALTQYDFAMMNASGTTYRVVALLKAD